MAKKDILEEIRKDQKKILSLQKKILKKEEQIEKEEQEVLRLERKELANEKELSKLEHEELDELKKIEELEKKILKDVEGSALKKITYRDVTKGMIGAFFGIVGHFAFAKGSSIAEGFSYLRSTTLLITSFIIITIFLYFAGFRKVDDKFKFKFIPVRAVVIYFSAITTIVIVLSLYGVFTLQSTFTEIYNTIAAISLLAVLGAGTADLIGKVEE
ncbi:MAG: hypothetical protein ACMXX9_03045 [Candidatus Woesearchaeota archaeon]